MLSKSLAATDAKPTMPAAVDTPSIVYLVSYVIGASVKGNRQAESSSDKTVP